jgi:hypothetical protein
MLLLNRHEISSEPQPFEIHEKGLFQFRAALGFQSVVRMALDDTWPSSRAPDIELEAAPIWGLYPASRAVIMRMELVNTNEDEVELIASLTRLKVTLRALEPKWKLAGIFVAYLSKRKQ